MKYLPFLLFITISSCTQTETHQNITNDEIKIISEKANLLTAETLNLLSVEIGIERSDFKALDEHLYGKFFHERSEFFIIENPHIHIANTEVNRLTLYFLDDVLCKKKYELKNDISKDLIKSFGGFKFKPLNTVTREISMRDKIVVTTEEGKTINSNLNKFQLKWNNLEDVTLKYIVDRYSIESGHHLIEELTAYKLILQQAERNIYPI